MAAAAACGNEKYFVECFTLRKFILSLALIHAKMKISINF